MTCLGIIFPVRNRWQTYTSKILHQCQQQGLLSTDSKDYVVVVDDGSTDETVERIKSLYPTVHLLQGDGNLWWGGAINEGMKYLSTFSDVEAIVWLNDDLTLPGDFLQTLKTTAHQAISRNAIIGGLTVADFDSKWIAFSGRIRTQSIRYIDHLTEDFTSVSCLNGNIVVLPSCVIRILGDIDTLRFPHYGPDYEYTIRAKKKSIQVLLYRDLKVTTHYSYNDVIRYMPSWMQFYLEKEITQRIKMFFKLRSLKFHHNIWTLLNMMHISSNVKWWSYELFYFKKIFQCIFYIFLPKKRIEKMVLEYCESEQIHPKLVADILNIL